MALNALFAADRRRYIIIAGDIDIIPHFECRGNPGRYDLPHPPSPHMVIEILSASIVTCTVFQSSSTLPHQIAWFFRSSRIICCAPRSDKKRIGMTQDQTKIEGIINSLEKETSWARAMQTQDSGISKGRDSEKERTVKTGGGEKEKKDCQVIIITSPALSSGCAREVHIRQVNDCRGSRNQGPLSDEVMRRSWTWEGRSSIPFRLPASGVTPHTHR